MSTAPYPPLHAGDDVDADFFDQLGDELDSPAEEAAPEKRRDAGLVNLADPPGGGLVGSGAGTRSSPAEYQEEVGRSQPQEEGNSHVDFNLEDAFTDLRLGTQDDESISHSANGIILGNSDDLGLHDSLSDGTHASEPRVTGFETSAFDTISSGIHPEEGAREAESGGMEDPVVSTLAPLDTARDESVRPEPEPDLSGQVSSASNLASEAASTVEEAQTSPPLAGQGGPTLPEASKRQVQTTEVQEVQWSSFGQGGFGSFSDFLSVVPADSSPRPDVNAFASNPGGDFFHFSDQSTSGVGSNAMEQQYDGASFFDLQNPYSQGQTQTGEAPPQLSTMYEAPAAVQVKSEDQPVYVQGQGLEVQTHSAQFYEDLSQNVQPLGQEEQARSDQLDHGQWEELQSQGQVQQTQFGQPDPGLWQEVAEYPGWLYNSLSGEWMEKNNPEGGAGTGSSWDYSSGQGYSDDRAGESQSNQWQGYEANLSSPEATGLQDASHLGQSITPTPLNEWTGDQNITGQANITHNPLFEEAVVEQNASAWQESTGEYSSNQSQSGWEDQYPGWYYDHHAQEWKPSQAAVVSAPPLAEEQVQSTSIPAVSYEQTAHASSFSPGYNAPGWSTGQDQQYNAGGGYFQDTPGQYDVVANSSQDISRSSTQAQMPGQWTSGQHQQLDSSSSYYQPGQPVSNGAIQQTWGASDSTEQVDPYRQPHLMPESQYNPYGMAQMPGYTPQPWSSRNSYEPQRYPQYTPQTSPKSVEEALRTSIGRPPHALSSFGFGGKLVIMKLKDPLSLQSSDGNQSFASGQAFVPGPINVHSLSQLVAQAADDGRGETGSLYFGALSRSTFTGPLVGGSVSSKDLSKWLEDRAANCQSEEPNFRSPGSLTMLWGLLTLACKHYGKLRSQVGLAGISSQEEDGSEAALAKLLTSGGDQSSWTMGSFSSSVCLQPMPSEHQLQLTASETKKLLVAGKRKEALKNAQQGQLWGAALVLARQLGEKDLGYVVVLDGYGAAICFTVRKPTTRFMWQEAVLEYYADTVAEMAQRQFLPGSPLRTLSLLLAGQPAEVFSGSNTLAASSKQPMQMPSSSGNMLDGGLGSMLEEWQENLSIMAANRTTGDDRVISHLGDCLWKVKGEVAAAHICYLVADANFESFSSTARLCLVGADHWKNPRTYATPEAIQRTEVYEYSKVLGNPQFILVSFQPYKLIYASMLAEAGKTAEALRYCQAVLKTLKTASRSPEVETCRLAAASLEERLRFHAQGGMSVNLAPRKIVRGLLSALDRGIHGIIGGPPPPTAQEQVQMGSTVESVTLQGQLDTGRFGASPSRSLAPLGPSASAEKLKETGRSMPQRSVSEPDFSTTMKEKAEQGKPTTKGGYLGRFGSVFSKAGGLVSMVSKTNKNEAKLGDSNKFYYDENLKRWVEEGVAAPQEEAAPPPPPMTANFASKVEDSSPIDPQFGGGPVAAPASASKGAYLGTPPVPPSNQFSARARQQGVRSRYVDTFNKGGNSTTPSKPAFSAFASAGRPAGSPLQPMNFFVPASSLDNSNGSVLNSENGTILGSSEENHIAHHQEQASIIQDRLGANQHSAVQNMFQQSGMVGSGMPRVPSSENTSAFGTGAMHRVPSFDNTGMVGSGMPRVPSSENTSAFGMGAMKVPSSDNTTAFGAGESAEGSGKSGGSPGNGEIGLINGYHSRANSWGGYPSNFQTSQTETNSSYDNSATNFNMYNGFSSQGAMNTPPSVGSYFPSPPKVDIYNPNTSAGIGETFVSPQPTLTPFMPAAMGGELRRGVVEARGGSLADVSLVGDDLQEVEL